MENRIDRKRPEAVFLSSSAYYKELPAPNGDEFALLGRSNVGKSSFINHILEKKALAKTSKTPGKTTLANFYKVDTNIIWVDLPGYGYAKSSIDEKMRWSKLIADYCEKRANLAGIIWLIDIRHIGIKADIEAFLWLNSTGAPIFPVLTKADKLNISQQKQQVKAAIEIFKFTNEPLICSVHDHSSIDKFWKKFDFWRKSLSEI